MRAMKLSHVFRSIVLQKAHEMAPSVRVGRKRSLTDDVAIDAIFKVLRTGMQWRELDLNVHFTTVFRRMHT